MLGFWFFTRVMNCAASDGDMTAVVANDAGWNAIEELAPGDVNTFAVGQL